MLRTIRLYGELAEKYGDSFRLAVETPGEAVHALCTQLRGLEADIRRGEFICIRGSYDDGLACDEILLRLRFGGLTEFHIIPAAIGHKSGVGKILLGIALIAATVVTAGAAFAAAGLGGFFTGASIFGLNAALSIGLGGFGLYAAGFGALLILGGVAQMLSPTPRSDGAGSSVDSREGYLFNGAANTSQQGGACPLVFGRILAGSVVVSAGITTERIGAATTDYSPESGNIVWDTMAYAVLP